MSGSTSAWSVLSVIAVLFFVVAGWQFAAVEGASQTQQVADEEHEIRINETVSLEADGVNYTVTNVYVPNASDTYTEGVDYTYDEWAGTVTWLNSSNTQTDAGDQAEVTYNASQQDDTTAEWAELTSLWPFLIGALLFLVVGAWVRDLINSSWGA